MILNLIMDVTCVKCLEKDKISVQSEKVVFVCSKCFKKHYLKLIFRLEEDE
jgi:hypothetical protein